jgi:hypothetical protein
VLSKLMIDSNGDYIWKRIQEREKRGLICSEAKQCTRNECFSCPIYKKMIKILIMSIENRINHSTTIK